MNAEEDEDFIADVEVQETLLRNDSNGGSGGSGSSETNSQMLHEGPVLHLFGGVDELFDKGQYPEPFAFDEHVAQVFDNMISRSVPMYKEAIDALIYWVDRFYQEGSVIYDLGCSTGTTIDVLCQACKQPTNFIGVDCSRPMIKRCRLKLSKYKTLHNITVQHRDITKSAFDNASVVIMNYTLQFIPYEERQRLMISIYNGLNDNGILFLSEKVKNLNSALQETSVGIYEDFKRRAGYSESEILRKKAALVNVLVPMTDSSIIEMLRGAGFTVIELIIKYNNFSTFIAVKQVQPSDSCDKKDITTVSTSNEASTKCVSSDPRTEISAYESDSNLPALKPAGIDKYFQPDPDYLYTILNHRQVHTVNAARRSFYLERRGRFTEYDAVVDRAHSLVAHLRDSRIAGDPNPISLQRAGDPNPISLQTRVKLIREADRDIVSICGDAQMRHDARTLSSSQRDESDAGKAAVTSLLKSLVPWRKGPFRVCEVDVDAEWRSDWKWQRMVEHISPLEDKVVCDLGCANGYFMFRMLEQKPKLVIGMDPNVKAWIEFHTLQLFAAQRNLTLEILTTDHVDMFPNTFDTMFCLGVVYHCADPIAALRKIHASLKPGGELILDCQCIPEEAIYPYTHRDDGTDGGGSGGGGEDSERSKEKLPLALFPRKTYANAKGIWFLPSKGCLLNWLARTQFHHVQVFYDEPLSVDEQRSTEWAPVNSLNESLDPKDPHKTVEGYPAPRRIYLKAKRK